MSTAKNIPSSVSINKNDLNDLPPINNESHKNSPHYFREKIDCNVSFEIESGTYNQNYLQLNQLFKEKLEKKIQAAIISQTNCIKNDLSEYVKLILDDMNNKTKKNSDIIAYLVDYSKRLNDYLKVGPTPTNKLIEFKLEKQQVVDSFNTEHETRILSMEKFAKDITEYLRGMKTAITDEIGKIKNSMNTSIVSVDNNYKELKKFVDSKQRDHKKIFSSDVKQDFGNHVEMGSSQKFCDQQSLKKINEKLEELNEIFFSQFTLLKEDMQTRMEKSHFEKFYHEEFDVMKEKSIDGSTRIEPENKFKEYIALYEEKLNEQEDKFKQMIAKMDKSLEKQTKSYHDLLEKMNNLPNKVEVGAKSTEYISQAEKKLNDQEIKFHLIHEKMNQLFEKQTQSYHDLLEKSADLKNHYLNVVGNQKKESQISSSSYSFNLINRADVEVDSKNQNIHNLNSLYSLNLQEKNALEPKFISEGYKSNSNPWQNYLLQSSDNHFHAMSENLSLGPIQSPPTSPMPPLTPSFNNKEDFSSKFFSKEIQPLQEFEIKDKKIVDSFHDKDSLNQFILKNFEPIPMKMDPDEESTHHNPINNDISDQRKLNHKLSTIHELPQEEEKMGESDLSTLDIKKTIDMIQQHEDLQMKFPTFKPLLTSSTIEYTSNPNANNLIQKTSQNGNDPINHELKNEMSTSGLFGKRSIIRKDSKLDASGFVEMLVNEDGYIVGEDGNIILDDDGKPIKLTEDQINQFENYQQKIIFQFRTGIAEFQIKYQINVELLFKFFASQLY